MMVDIEGDKARFQETEVLIVNFSPRKVSCYLKSLGSGSKLYNIYNLAGVFTNLLAELSKSEASSTISFTISPAV